MTRVPRHLLERASHTKKPKKKTGKDMNCQQQLRNPNLTLISKKQSGFATIMLFLKQDFWTLVDLFWRSV